MINGKPIICVTNSSNHVSTKGEATRDLWLNDTYAAAVSKAGGVVVIPGERNAEDYADFCDGLLLTGGPDIEPEVYGETKLNDTVKCDPIRTAFEIPLTKAFIAKKKPIFTICRGFQLINCVLGGSLYQDIVEQLGYVHIHPNILRHNITAADGSIMHRLFGKEFKVNSYHHQAVKELGEGLRVTARSVEGIIEAYEHESLPIFGVQFHPERLTGSRYDGKTQDFAPLFEHFINMAKSEK
ncbi:MAG: gamma-glutamyl-gamma-aminobutyrate hydrolase family protein [Clostridia bacterium]|nr:gamma-glutamyl-gamma-aminobutyrate hydrolase family protein [Clostridia bacterium]